MNAYERPADDPRQCRCCPRPLYRVVPRLPQSGRTGPRRMAERYGAEMTVPDWKSRLVCGQCGSRRVDMVVSGERR